MAGQACARVVAEWNQVIEEFLVSVLSIPPSMIAWAGSYNGKGAGEVDTDAMPEPYLGSLDGQPAGVFLALNPGGVNQRFQHRGGTFPMEIQKEYGGSYSAWAASWPYLRDPWVREAGRNPHHENRLKFLRSWLGEPSLTAKRMVGFELYPWHSKAITATMRPDRDIVRHWVWEPAAELNAPIFAFGAPWFDILENTLGLTPIVRLGRGEGHIDYPTAVASRRIGVYLDQASGARVIAERHSGSAGPPSASEALHLHEMLDSLKLY
jgi:hypothetical protein